MSHELICKECGVEFSARTMFVSCCSSKCRMRRWRRTERGRACVVRSNAKVKRPDIEKVCELCRKGFVTARKSQVLCSECSGGSAGNYEAQKRSRKKNLIKHRARDVVNKRIQRGSMKKEPCEVCGEDAEAHHHDYNKPLDVTWLCRWCYDK